ncbi:MAG: orotate phosphoribosyltransferase [Thermodesulfobacteriota bacterium]
MSINTDFAQFLAGTAAVQFGEFTLKSNIKSNIFFNFGELFLGSELIQVGNYFADFIVENSLDHVDVLFGPAYKGINICIATSIALHQRHNISIPFAYNRKDRKEYAEGGQFVGYDLSRAGHILLLDDVITDCGTKFEVVDALSVFSGATIDAIVVGVDREEHGATGELSRQRFVRETGIDLFALTSKSEVLKYR